jgi:hypothetical protein
MNKEIIQLKLERLRRYVERIREKTPDTAEALLGDDDLQDIICVNPVKRCAPGSVWILVGPHGAGSDTAC